MYQTSWIPSGVGEQLTDFDASSSPGPLSSVQTMSSTIQRGGRLFLHPGQMQVPATPPEGARDEDGGWVSSAHPCACWPDFPGLHLRCGLCLLGGALCTSLWCDCASGLGKAQLHWGSAHSLGIPGHGLEGGLCLQPEMNVKASQRCFALLGVTACQVGSWITCLFFLLNVPGWFSHKSVFFGSVLSPLPARTAHPCCRRKFGRKPNAVEKPNGGLRV